MVILNLKIDNLYLYDDFEINFTYNRKLKNNTIDHEWIAGYPNFKYRKVNVLMGANSSGKTTLGKVIMDLQNIIAKGIIPTSLFTKIDDKDKFGMLELDFYLANKLYRYALKINNKQIINEQLHSYKLEINDSYVTAKNKLELEFNKQYKDGEIYNSQQMRNIIEEFGWYYSFAFITNQTWKTNDLNTKLLEKLLKGFDKTITKVEKIANSTNSFNIIFKNGDNVLVQDGEIINKDRISSGTFESIRIASIIEQMTKSERNYFIDENLVHSHTELEKGILNLMISKLYKNSQLFFTTHNMDLLDLNLPIHSFQFLKSDFNKFEVVDIAANYSKNDRNFRKVVENDVFQTLPNTDFLLELFDE